jgi:hypothetical protein
MGPWLKTAPIASLLASVVNTKGLVKSGYCNIGSEISEFFKVTKAFSVSSSQTYWAFFVNSSVNGLAILPKLGINLL